MAESIGTENVATDQRRVKVSILGRMLYSTSGRLFKKLNGDHPAAHGGTMHTWLFHFVDIIYVGTIGNISKFIDHCGDNEVNGSLFAASFSLLVIMFYTRSAFDRYVSISNAGGLLHVAVFCLYASAVFVMSLNIAEERARDEKADMGFGACVAKPAYVKAFAWAFVASRVVLITMYLLYVKVFHESNVIGTFTGDLPPVSRETLAVAKRASARRSSANAQLEDHFSEDSADLYLQSARYSVVTRHFSRIYIYKVFPLIASAIVMLALAYSFEHPQPGVIFPTAAIIEVLIDFIPSLFLNSTSSDDWDQFASHRHFVQERLGSFFLLVMGEAMLGFHVVFYGAFDPSQTSYTVLL